MLIYKATSKTSGKVYIGQTSQPLQLRINQHNSRAFSTQYNYHFHNAIRKYGADDFIYEIIEDNIHTQEELNEREKYWIQYYDSYNNGYNSTQGGDGSVRRNDELIKSLFEEGKTTEEICELTGYNRSTVYKSYEVLGLQKENQKRVNELTKKRCSFEVEQYDLLGNFIRKWSSATECGEFFGNQSLISAICNQKQSILSAYGYLFKYTDDDRDIAEWVERYNNKKTSGKPKKKIGQYDLNNNLITMHASAAEAARTLGKDDKSNICAAARKGKKAYGYYWRYE